MAHMCPIHAVSNYKKNAPSNYGYILCSFVTAESKHEGYSIVDIPATTWAVFPSDLEDDCGNLGKTLLTIANRFYNDWLPIVEG